MREGTTIDDVFVNDLTPAQEVTPETKVITDERQTTSEKEMECRDEKRKR